MLRTPALEGCLLRSVDKGVVAGKDKSNLSFCEKIDTRPVFFLGTSCFDCRVSFSEISATMAVVIVGGASVISDSPDMDVMAAAFSGSSRSNSTLGYLVTPLRRGGVPGGVEEEDEGLDPVLVVGVFSPPVVVVVVTACRSVFSSPSPSTCSFFSINLDSARWRVMTWFSVDWRIPPVARSVSGTRK